MSLQTTVLAVAFGLCGLVLCTSALSTRKRWSAPATGSFAVAVGVAGAGALVIAATLLDGPTNTLAATVLVAFALPVPWLLFAVEYTGRGEWRSPRTVALAVVPVVLGGLPTALVVLDRLFPWLAWPTGGSVGGVFAFAVFALSIAEGIALLYAGGVMLIATGLLLWAFHRYEHLDSTSGALVGVFGSVPWLALLFGFQVSNAVPLALPASVSVGFLVGTGAVGVLVLRGQLFDRLPAAGNIGPATVVRDLEDGVLVTDAEGRVIRLNAAADRMLSDSGLDPLGGDLDDLLGNEPSELADADAIELRADGGRRLFEPTISELADQHGRRLGYAVVLHDVTERRIREQRLEVLNRVLRHNLRNESTVITGYAGILADEVDDPAAVDFAEKIVETGRQLSEISETAREIDALLAASDSDPSEFPLATLVEDVLADVPDGGTVERDVPDGLVVTVSEDLLGTALSELVENAFGHSDVEDPHVAVRARYDPEEEYPVTVSVIDDGPGIPDMERDVIREGVETPMHHSSGLGLWLVRWSVVRAGGDLDIDSRDPRGTVVSIRLPEGRLSGAEHPPAEVTA